MQHLHYKNNAQITDSLHQMDMTFESLYKCAAHTTQYLLHVICCYGT